jgi:hypothetical protein
VREPEQQAGAHDGDDDAVGPNEREPEPSIRQLLDDGREDRHREEEGDERSNPARVPLVRDEPLLLRRVEVPEERQEARVRK